jgi:hypothetical protein
MSALLWQELIELRSTVDLATETVARRLSAVRAERDASRVTEMILHELRSQVRTQLDRCAVRGVDAHFRAFDSATATDSALRLISFWLNERIRKRLPEADRADWVPVGPEDVDLRNGGHLFFDEVDHLLHELVRRQGHQHAKMDALVAVALFCLEQGFTGKYAGQYAELERYKSLLRREPEQRVVRPSELPSPALVRTLPMTASAVGACLAFYMLCVALSAWIGVG